MIITFSKKLAKIPFLELFLGEHCQFTKLRYFIIGRPVRAVVGWGNRPTTRRARIFAQKKSVPFIALEDGFIRSFGLGAHYPPLSIVTDFKGIYYDVNDESTLEALLSSNEDILSPYKDKVYFARNWIDTHCISKYNHAPQIILDSKTTKPKILVIDQTRGDASIKFGRADDQTFINMLEAARNENSGAHIYVKLHPETVLGKKFGHLTHIQDDINTTIIKGDCNPVHLIKQVNHVYTVTSTMGFEALLVGKKVTVFGTPWYAGWGVTDDRQIITKRERDRSIDELFVAAYFMYARYLNPETHKLGNVFDVLNWIIFQKKQNNIYLGRKICIGFRRWKAMSIKPILGANSTPVVFVKSVAEAEKLSISKEDNLIFWGASIPDELIQLKEKTHARLLQIEDGIIRSVGLGSDLIRPLSLVFDDKGLYFNATQPSRLEHILNNEYATAEELVRAEYIQRFIIKHNITKYNIEPCDPPNWDNPYKKKCLLVIGQVDDDASIRYGALKVKTNLQLLETVRTNNPDAYIVYKPHPEITAKNRKTALTQSDALNWADYIETRVSITSCIKVCDEIHTITSSSGFDAILRNKKVFAYGKPFYAGWGLLENDVEYPNRIKKLSVSELIVGTLIKYPIYWDWVLNGYTTCEATLNEIVRQKEQNTKKRKLKLNSPYIKRVICKINIYIRYMIENYKY